MRRAVSARVAAAAVAVVLLAACTADESAESQPFQPIQMDVDANVEEVAGGLWQSTSFPIAGSELSLLIDKATGAVSRIDHAAGRLASAPDLPDGLEPYAGGAGAEDWFYVIGQTCADYCRGTLVRWRPGEEQWTDVPVEETFDILDGAVDVGMADGSFYMATGTGGASPAMYVLDDGADRWRPIEQPKGLNGGNAPICSTDGQVYRFFGFPLTDGTGSSGDSSELNRMVWALDDDDGWDQIEVDAVGPAVGQPAQQVLCTGGALLLGRAADGTTVRVRRDDGGRLVQDGVALPAFDPPSDQAYPSAAMSTSDGSILGGPDPTAGAPWPTPKGSHLVSSDQRGNAFTALVATPDAVQVWIWPTHT